MFQAALFGSLAVIALLVTAVGVYAIASFDVVRRRGELGIRYPSGRCSDRAVETGGGYASSIGCELSTDCMNSSSRRLFEQRHGRVTCELPNNGSQNDGGF